MSEEETIEGIVPGSDEHRAVAMRNVERMQRMGVTSNANEQYIILLLEELVGESRLDAVRLRHELNVSSMLDGAESEVARARLLGGPKRIPGGLPR